MKNGHKNRLEQLRGSFLIMLLFTVVFSACQKENPSYPENRQELKLVFSAEPEFQTGTEYIPMKGATRAGTDMVRIHNEYRYIILEEMSGGDYMVVSTELTKFDPNKGTYDLIEINSTNTFSSVVTSLRPGAYKIIIFTSPSWLNFNGAIEPGFIVPESNKPQEEKYAVKYVNFWMYDQLPYEVFYVQQDFTIEKTTGLNVPNPIVVNLKLERRSTKFRTVLQETTDADYATGIPYATSLFANYFATSFLMLEKTDPLEGPFPWGLDMWGKLWYDPAPDPLENNGHTFIYCVTDFVKQRPKISPATPGLTYYMADYQGQITSSYFFSQPKISTKVTNASNIELVFTQTKIALYKDIGAHEFTLENNKITGIVLKLNREFNKVGGKSYYGLDAVFESGTILSDPANLFHGNFEHE